MNTNEQGDLTVDIRTLRQDVTYGYRVWNMNQIYHGKEINEHLWIPNVGDKVEQYNGNVITEYLVTDVDKVTYIPTLTPIIRTHKQTEEKVYFKGMGPALNTEAWRVFYDRNVVPHTLMVDTSFIVYGAEASYLKLFRGTDTSPLGNVISMYRNSPDKQYSENVPLYRVNNHQYDSDAVKRPSTFHTTEHLESGDLVTVAVYADSGKLLYEQHLLVADGSAVRALDAEQTYVLGIELVSPFISTADDDLLEIPVNMSLDDVFTRAKVHYSDGQSRTMTIDQGRMALLGLDYYTPTRVGETGSLPLRYLLAENEHAWNSAVGEFRHVTRIYRYRTTNVDGNYSVMLNIIPVYNKLSQQWDLRYYLHNLNRDLMLDVTDKVETGINSELFNGRKYGAFQHIVVALQLERLGLGLKPFRYVQQFDIGLTAPSTGSLVPYQLNYDNNQDDSYGESNTITVKVTQAGSVINLNEQSQHATVEDFLRKTYYAARPLYDAKQQAAPVVPTHFILRSLDGHYEQEFAISQFNADIPFPRDTYQVSNQDTMLVTFIAKSGRQKLYLNTTGWQVKGAN